MNKYLSNFLVVSQAKCTKCGDAWIILGDEYNKIFKYEELLMLAERSICEADHANQKMEVFYGKYKTKKG